MLSSMLRGVLVALLVFCRSAFAMDAMYAIKPGDVLQVSVWKEPDLTVEVLVRPDGGFSFPLAGEIDATGKSAEEIRKELAERISTYIPDPEVTVALRQVNGLRVFVIGKVNKPGMFPLVSNVDVLKALSMAGGMTTFAAVNRIKILRRNGDEQVAIPFKYGDIEEGQNLEQNIVLKSGDVVVVP